jgi:ribosome biogenesis GTPase
VHGDAVCGDVVHVSPEGRIDAIDPRRGVLARARGSGDDDATDAHVIAANVDVVGIALPLDRPLSFGFLARALTLAHAAGARPLVLLTKRDVLDASDGPDAVAAACDETAHHAPGVEVLAISAHDHDDIELVRALVPAPETMALLGASGAGKSTLTNALAGADVQAIGDVDDESHKGRHTTTGARLVSLAHGAFIVDTAGVRTLGMLADDDDVNAAFPDVDALAAQCRFSDCAHEGEPGCAVRGAIDPDRLDAYRKLLREARRHRLALDPIAARAERRRLGARSDAARQRGIDKRR